MNFSDELPQVYLYIWTYNFFTQTFCDRSYGTKTFWHQGSFGVKMFWRRHVLTEVFPAQIRFGATNILFFFINLLLRVFIYICVYYMMRYLL